MKNKANKIYLERLRKNDFVDRQDEIEEVLYLINIEEPSKKLQKALESLSKHICKSKQKTLD